MSESIEKKETKAKAIELIIAKRYPELYETLKRESEEKGEELIDTLIKYASYGYSVKAQSALITKDDLKHITPESLYASLKFVRFFLDEFYRVQAYANIANIQALYQIVESLTTARLSQLLAGREGKESAPILLPPPSPSTIENIAKTILRAIELFTIGRPEVTDDIAQRVAQKLIELSQKAPPPSQ